MRALLACGVLVVAALADRAPAAAAASPAAVAVSRTTAERAAGPAHLATTGPLVKANAATPAGAHAGPNSPRPLSKASVPPTALSAPRRTVPAALGGPPKYDAKKGAILGGTVMPHRP